MKAMVINRLGAVREGEGPLGFMQLDIPEPGEKDILIKVSTCGVCHTELDEIEGRTPPPRLPVIPGHQVVGKVIRKGSDASKYNVGERIGVAWIYSSCGHCRYCKSGLENLCEEFKATGRDTDGGYAEYMKVPESSAFLIPEDFTDEEAAPLLCAGAIGYRSLMLTEIQNGQALGLTGFGASGHLVLKMAKHLFPDTDVVVFARSPGEQRFALELGAAWAGDTTGKPPFHLDAIIDTTPAWKPVVYALENLNPGGRLVINAIRKEDADKNELLKLDYDKHLWMEKEVKSVANITPKDVSEFLELAAEANIKPEYQLYSLENANKALTELKNRKIKGAKVLKIG